MNGDKSVLVEYESSVTVPDKPWTGKQFVIAPVGLIGSGKTTVLRGLSEHLGLVRTCGDDIRLLLKKHGLPLDEVKKIHVTAVQSFLNKGYSVAIDSDSVSDEAIKALDNLKNSGVTVLWLHITAPESVILDRLEKRTGHALTQDVALWKKNYYERKALHQGLSMPFLYTFDTSRNDLDRQLTEAEGAIHTALA